MPLYEGECHGGPWDGHQYAHAKSTLTIVRCDSIPWSKTPHQAVMETFGEYRHVAGHWVWHEGS